MTLIPLLHWIASVAFERLLYSLAEGSLLALAVTLALRFIPQKSSRTAFVIWFSTLLASALVPLLALDWGREVGDIGAARALITVPVSVALYVSLAWLVVACAGLTRVIAGAWQLRRLRQSCQDVCVQQLGPELAGIVEDFARVRPVSILVSQRVQVPTAIGFLKPAVIIPAWMAEEGPSDELKHVLLHELAHLRRRDDWTNLVQKIVGALLFFHPGVWWMQRELSMHREMACDDEVLAQTASPRTYAECLARVAEKSFLRRQVALAQAAVSRMRQLTQRVSRILDPNRRATTQLWKPAIPAVVTLALISGISGSWAPSVVRVGYDANSASASPAAANVMPSAVPLGVANLHGGPGGIQTGAKGTPNSEPLLVPAKHMGTVARRGVPAGKITRPKQDEHTLTMLAANKPKAALPSRGMAEGQNEFVLVIETRETITAGADGWHVSVQQLRWLVPISRIQKQIPSKI